ncbi:MBL fold metallo-hydrolase [bacterium]|mgnify:CR=1 FL=1|nr:MBL fold metallo-hydrolase [bacterium]
MKISKARVAYTAFLILNLLGFATLKTIKHNPILAFLDVGQGSSILYQDNGCQVLIDTGNFSKATKDLHVFMPSLDKDLEHVFISHLDQDHYAGLYDLTKRYAIKNIYQSYLAEPNIYLAQTLNSLNTKQLKATDKLELCQNEFQVLWPPAKKISDNKNEESLVLLFRLGAYKVLFTADLGCNLEKQLLRTYPELDVDIFVTGHHGSRHSNCLSFLKAIKAKFAVTQAGKHNSYKHPHTDVRKRLAFLKIQHLELSSLGAIFFYVESEALQWQAILTPWQKAKQDQFLELKAW